MNHCKAISRDGKLSRLVLVLVVTRTRIGDKKEYISDTQGASDWYMRFHTSFDFVKRNVDRPVTKSLIVRSVSSSFVVPKLRAHSTFVQRWRN